MNNNNFLPARYALYPAGFLRNGSSQDFPPSTSCFAVPNPPSLRGLPDSVAGERLFLFEDSICAADMIGTHDDKFGQNGNT